MDILLHANVELIGLQVVLTKLLLMSKLLDKKEIQELLFIF